MRPEGGRFDDDTYARARADRMRKAEAIANKTDDPIRSMNEQLGWTDTGKTKSGFGAAFAAARAAGKKDFTFGGKSYNTQTKEEAAKPAPVAAKGSGRGGQGGPTAEELDAYASSRAKAPEKPAEKSTSRKMFEKTGLLPDRDRKMSGEEAAGKAADVAMAAIPLARGLGGAAKTASKSRALAERFDKITPIPNRPAAAGREALSGPGRATALPKGADAPKLGGPSGASRVGTEAAPKQLPAPREQATTWKSRESANADVAAKRGTPAASKKPATTPNPRKPKASVAPAREPKSATAARKRTRYKDDEAGVEFAKGGMVKRGWGKARCK